MIKDPFLLVCFLLFLEALVLFLEGQDRFKRFFSFLPHIFWIYFLPMLAATAGLVDSKSPVLGMITTYLLPPSLFLLLVTVDLKAIARLGAKAIFLMLAGSVGIMAGAVTAFGLFKGVVGPEFWSGFGAITGSWTGGSANMIAVKEALQTPEEVFLPMVVVDTVVPYLWMGALVALAGWQNYFDRWNRSDQALLNQLKEKMEGARVSDKKPLTLLWAVMLIVTALVAGFVAQQLASYCPVVKNVFSEYTWTIVIITGLGLAGSLTPVRKLERIGADKAGYILLYFVLTSIGAKANLLSLDSALILILAGFVILMVHTLVLLIAARLIRAPMFLVAAASQANVGGVASAPIVAELYQPGFASVGLLLAIFGNIIGTYAGILTAHLCRMMI